MDNEPIALEKMEGAIKSLIRAKENYIKGNKLDTKGDLDYAIDKAMRARVNVELELEDEGKIIK